MANTIELNLLNGETATLELGFNPVKCMIIARDFPETNEVFSLATNNSEMEINMLVLTKAIYVAYRQANLKKALTFEQFYDPETGYEFDLEQGANIYASMLDKNTAKEYAKQMEKLGKKAKKGK